MSEISAAAGGLDIDVLALDRVVRAVPLLGVPVEDAEAGAVVAADVSTAGSEAGAVAELDRC
jgi:hypothetical protein